MVGGVGLRFKTKMGASKFLCCLLLVNLPYIYLAAEDPPLYTENSFKAVGEIVETISETSSGRSTIQLAFEEHYNSKTSDAVFIVWESGGNFTFVTDGWTGKTVVYDQGTNCRVEGTKDWLEIGTSIPGYAYLKNKILFSVRQLLSLDKKFLVESEKAKADVIRGIPSTSWVYKIDQTVDKKKNVATIKAHFSNAGWSTASRSGVRVPLGFDLQKQVTDESGQTVDNVKFSISVFAFVLDAVDRKAFAPREHVYCKGWEHPLKFPFVPFHRAISIKAEVIFPGNSEIKNMDVYYDTLNKMLRVDLDRIDSEEIEGGQQTYRRFTSQITSFDLGATFRFDTYRKKATCTVTPIDKYNFDMQEIVNPKLERINWSLENMIGSKTTNYVYIGQTTKRNIPCHLFQGIRKDWPDQSGDVTSLWEWCLSTNFTEEVNQVNFKDDELGIVSAYVNITESKNDNFMVGYPMIYHFYDIIPENPLRLSLTRFNDIQWCFDEKSKVGLQFVSNVTVNKDNKIIFENATSDPMFLRLWRGSIADSASILITSMRISQMRASIVGDKLIISFTLFAVHDKLPEESKKGQPSLQAAYKALNNDIDKGELTISYYPSQNSNPIYMAAMKGSLSNTTGIPIDTDPDIITTPNPLGNDKAKYDGYAPGDTAGVCIGMIFAGVIFGAGGTYFRFFGFPFLKR